MKTAKYTEIVSVHKAILAKLLAAENITVEFQNVDTAYFELRTRLLVLPNLKAGLPECIYNLFTGHECGHALYTPTDQWEYLVLNKVCSQTILNIVEDVRIEKLIKRAYPGIRKDFYEGYKELLNRNFFGIQFKDVQALNFLDRLNIHAKCGPLVTIFFSKEEQILVDRCHNAETWDEVVRISKDLYDFMKANKQTVQDKDSKNPEKLSNNSDSESEDESSSGESSKTQIMDDMLNDLLESSPSDDAKEGVPSDESDDKKNSATSGSGKEQGKSSDGPPNEGTSTGSENTDKKVEEEFTSETIEHLRKQLEDLIEKSKDEIVNSYVPEAIRLNDIVRPWTQILSDMTVYKDVLSSEKYYTNYLVSHKDSVDFLYNEFNLRRKAIEFQKTQINKTGTLDTKKLFAYSFADDLFRRNETSPTGQSHGLIIIVDWSGSMSCDMQYTIQQLFCVTDFCQKAHIPFEVYSFVTIPLDHNKHEWLSTKKPKGNEFNIANISLNNILSSQMKKRDYVSMQKMLLGMINEDRYYCVDYMKLSGTPLNESIIATMDLVPRFKQMYNLEIVNVVFLTDGEGCNIGTKNQYWPPPGKAYIHDAKSKSSFKVNPNANIDQKNILLRILKERTGSNVIGFFIEGATRTDSILKKYFPSKISTSKLIEAKACFDKQYYMSVDGLGYDSLFVLNRLGYIPTTTPTTEKKINSKALKHIVEERELQTIISNKVDRLRSRAMLRKFISLIS